MISAYAQCRTQIDGSWTPADIGTNWECQKPGDKATGTLAATPSSTSAASSGSDGTSGSSGSTVANTSGNSGSTGSSNDTDSSGSSGSTGGSSTPVNIGNSDFTSKKSAAAPQSQNFAKLAPGADKLSGQGDSGESDFSSCKSYTKLGHLLLSRLQHVGYGL